MLGLMCGHTSGHWDGIMLDGFQLEIVDLPEATLRVRYRALGRPYYCYMAIPAPKQRGTRLHRF